MEQDIKVMAVATLKKEAYAWCDLEDEKERNGRGAVSRGLPLASGDYRDVRTGMPTAGERGAILCALRSGSRATATRV